MQNERHVKDQSLRKEPNKYAPASDYTFTENIAKVRGYQNFNVNTINNAIEPLDANLSIKSQALMNSLIGANLVGKTFADLGGNNGYYSLLVTALLGAEAIVLDIDKNSIRNVRKLANDLKIKNLKAERKNISSLNTPSDFVIAFALVHWIYNLTTPYNSLEDSLSFVCKLAKEAIFVEWVDPSDELIQNFRHLNGKETSKEDYTKENFISILSRHFDSVVPIGETSPTRQIYLAANTFFWEKTKQIRLNLDANKIHSYSAAFSGNSQKKEIMHTFTYSLDDSFAKQASNPIGAHEAQVLLNLDHPSVPKVLKIAHSNNFTFFEISKAPGSTLTQILRTRNLQNEEQESIVHQLEHVSSYLKSNNVVHRDITPQNIMWCRELMKLTLIDFAWALSNQTHPLITPPTLGLTQDKQFCNYISGNERTSDDYAIALIFTLLGNTEYVNNAIQRKIQQSTEDNSIFARKILEAAHSHSRTMHNQ